MLHIIAFIIQRYTFEFSPGMRAVVDQMTNCEDIFLNAMVADDGGAVGIMADRWMEYSCAEGCGKTADNSISMAEGHYEERSRVRMLMRTTYLKMTY